MTARRPPMATRLNLLRSAEMAFTDWRGVEMDNSPRRALGGSCVAVAVD